RPPADPRTPAPPAAPRPRCNQAGWPAAWPGPATARPRLRPSAAAARRSPAGRPRGFPRPVRKTPTAAALCPGRPAAGGASDAAAGAGRHARVPAHGPGGGPSGDAAARAGSGGFPAIAPGDVLVDDADEVIGDVLAAQGHGLLAVDEHRRRGRFAGAGQRDAD